MTTSEDHLAHGLALALLAGEWTPDAAAQRIRRTLGVRRTSRFVRALTRETFARYRHAPNDRPRELADALQDLPAWHRSARRRSRIVHWTPGADAPAPRPSFVPRIVWRPQDLGDLASQLGLTAGELAWFADTSSQLRTAPPRLRHYRVHVIRRAGGGVRVIEAPKVQLRAIQRRLLTDLIGLLPPHRATHGGVAGRGVRTALEPHAGHRVVIRVDLESFFATISAGRVYGVLRSAGLSESVSHTLTGLTTTTLSVEDRRALPGTPAGLRRPHLPQGAPTSTALANLVAFTLDRRLAGLIRHWDGTYTRYVDDLVLSGDDLPVRVVLRAVAEVVRDCGFRVNEAKTTVRRAHVRQGVLGAVVNRTPGVPRRDRDRLRAVLHNCAIHGPRSQCGEDEVEAFRQRLAGRIAWVGGVNPRHGRDLRVAFARIDWSS